MAEQNSQIARELKQLDTKELDPTSLNVRELRGRSVSEVLQMPSIRQPNQLQYVCMCNSKFKNQYYVPPRNCKPKVL